MAYTKQALKYIIHKYNGLKGERIQALASQLLYNWNDRQDRRELETELTIELMNQKYDRPIPPEPRPPKNDGIWGD